MGDIGPPISSGDWALMNPMTGTASRCARREWPRCRRPADELTSMWLMEWHPTLFKPHRDPG